METRERQYGVECFDNLNTDQNMGIYVDINTEAVIDSPFPSATELDLRIRHSVELSEDDSSEEECMPGSQNSDVLPQRDEIEGSQTREASSKSESEDEDSDSDSDLKLNQMNKKHNTPNSITNKLSIIPHKSRSSYSSDSSDDDSSVESKSPFSCQYCEKTFRSNADLTRHVRCHTGEKPYTCEHCSKSFTQSAHLQRHLLTHPDKASAHQCPSCDKSYPLKIQLVGHMAVHSKKDPITKVKTKLKCEKCQKLFSAHHKYKNHMAAHLNGTLHCCEVCGRAFKMQSYLTVHMRTHTATKVYTGDKPFACGVCGKAFLSSSNLELHATIHKYERTSFSCEVCGKEFSRKSNYVAHAKSHYR